MSEGTPEGGAKPTEPAGKPDGGGGYTPPASQDELNRIIAERLTRERAKFSDYDDLKAKASKLDEIDASRKTEAERLTERAAAAEKRAAETGAQLLRLEVAAEKGLNASQAKRLVGSTREELAADADELVKTFTPAAPSFDGGARRTADTPPDMNALIRKAAGY